MPTIFVPSLNHHGIAGHSLKCELRAASKTKSQRPRADSGRLFAAQYQQTPVPPGGAMIRREWLRYYQALPDDSHRIVLQSWDTAVKDGAQNDWSVCTTWMKVDNSFYLIDVTRGRYDYPRLKATAIAIVQRHQPHYVLIADACTGAALAQELRNIQLSGAVRLVPVERDKIGRLYVHQAKFEAGQVLFPKGATFLPELEAELLAFPQSKNDDQVDSISQALSFTSEYDATMSWVG
jgi:predicted phage terminase large subunit-like protein